MAVNIKIMVFWDTTPCTLVDIHTNILEEPATCSSKMLVLNYMVSYPREL